MRSSYVPLVVNDVLIQHGKSLCYNSLRIKLGQCRWSNDVLVVVNDVH